MTRRRTTPPPARSRGFTLLEILVAIVVYAIFSTLTYATLSRIADGRERLNEERDKWRVLALSFTQMEEDLSRARGRPIRFLDGVPRGAFIGRQVDPRAEAEPSIEFTRGGMFVPADGATSDLVRVAYALKEGALVRLDQPPTSEPRETTLIKNVDNMTVRFYSADAGWASEWIQNENLTLMPSAVELSFDLAGVGRLTRVFTVHE
jgi:general secretion pathway protein J